MHHSKDNIAEFDSLRAIAVVAVFGFHAGWPGFAGGYLGVDIFFVLSGFFISRHLFLALRQGPLDLRRFYIRRVRRLAPALLLMLSATAVAGWWILSPARYQSLAEATAAVLLLSSNFWHWQHIDYFSVAAAQQPLLHTWSLAVEEQFYLFYPLLFLLFARIGWLQKQAFWFILLCIVMVISFIGQFYFSIAAFYLLPTRAWQLLLGAYIAYCSIYQSTPLPCKAQKAELLNVLALLLMLLALTGVINNSIIAGFVVCATTAAMLLWLPASTALVKLLRWKPLVLTGLISYSFYLWHQPLLVLLKLETGTLSLWQTVMALVLLWVLAYGSWRFVEQPMRNPLLPERRFWLFLAVLLLPLLCWLLFTLKHHGVATRLGDAAAYIQSATASQFRQKCHLQAGEYTKPAQSCVLGEGPVRWAVFGDSHGVELSAALSAALSTWLPQVGKKEAVRQLTYSQCAPFSMASQQMSPCAKWSRDALSYLAEQKDIHTVILTYRIHGVLWGYHEDVYPALPNAVAEQQRLQSWQQLMQLQKELIAAGKTVVWVLQAPELPAHIQDLLMKMPANDNAIQGMEKTWWTQRSAFVTERLAEVAGPVVVLDPAKVFCERNFCLAGQSGVAWYFDEDHISVSGAQALLEYYREELLQYDH